MKTKRALKVPENNGEFFCSHDLPEIPPLLKSNQELIDSYSFKIAEVNYNEFRKIAKKEILNSLTDRNEELFPLPYIVTGHQPGLCHPGIWIKNFLVDKLARENKGTAFDIIIDSDCSNEIGCSILTWNETIKRRKEILMKLNSHQPFECCSVPGSDQFRDFYQKIKAGLQSSPVNTLIKYAEIFFQKGESALASSKNLVEFLVKTKKRYEASVNLQYFDVMLSRVCKTRSFLLFVLHIVQNIKRFHDIYNQLLEEYRISHKLRYKANPFPDLKKDADKFEIPFWCINDNKRKPVWVIHEGSCISIYVEDICLFRYKKGDFDHAIKIIDEGEINLRPKAVLLTLFFRLFFADIFIHGISGAKYDEITDGIMEKYYEIKPPHYIATSLTLFPDLPIDRIQINDVEKLKTIIRNIKLKPEIFEDKVEGEVAKGKFNKLTEEKKKLFRQKPSKKEKKDHYRKLKTVTEELSSFLDHYCSEVIDQLRILEEKEHENRTACFREFPYFFYDINKVKKMIK